MNSNIVLSWGRKNICSRICWCGWYCMLCYWDVECDTKLAEDARWVRLNVVECHTINMLRSSRSKLFPLLTGNCSFQEQHKRRLFLVIFILFDGTAHILHLLITLQWYCQLLYHAKKWYSLDCHVDPGYRVYWYIWSNFFYHKRWLRCV